MMFSGCYDKSLWLILKNSNWNIRNGIIDFVKNIPDGLYMDMKNKIYVSEKNRECCNNLCIFQNYKFFSFFFCVYFIYFLYKKLVKI